MLNTEANKRPNINEVLFHLENIAQTRGTEFLESLKFLKKTESLLHIPPQNPLLNNSQPPHVNNVNQQGQHASAAASNSNNNWMSSGLFKGGSLFKTIKDASSKVMDSVQQ